MSVESVSLDGVRSLTGLLERLPQGTAARQLAERLGLWSTTVHNSTTQRKVVFPSNFSGLGEAELSDSYAYWLSEVFRSTELVGLLEGQKTVLTLESKSTRATARAGLRRKARQLAEAARESNGAVPKDPTTAQLADEVEEDERVIANDRVLGMLAVVLESAKAYKEACLAATAGLSREYSLRQAQMGARLRG